MSTDDLDGDAGDDTTPSLSEEYSTKVDPEERAGQLLNTSSVARRLAHGDELSNRHLELAEKSNESNTPLPSKDVGRSISSISAESSKKSPQGIGGDIDNMAVVTDDETNDASATMESSGHAKEVMGNEGADKMAKSSESSEANASTKSTAETDVDNKRINETALVNPATTPSRPPQVRGGAAYYAGNNQKNAFDAVGEYIAFFFQKAEVYEEELELRQSQRNLQVKMDKTRHGPSARNIEPTSPEGGGDTSNEGTPGPSAFDVGRITLSGKTASSESDRPQEDDRSSTSKLTDSMEARAAVEAMSTFRDFQDVKKQMSRDDYGDDSFDAEDDAHDQKRQNISDAVPEKMEVVDESTLKEWKLQWEDFVEEKRKNRFDEVAIKSLTLPCSVDEFYHYVLEDNATHSIGKFMKDIGELDVSLTPWEPSSTPSPKEPTKRTIQYTHPVNAPMAPPTAKARKQQVLYKFGSIGVCLETCTLVEEVPMADCFVVDDRLWVNEAEDGTGGCTVAVTFQIRFVKSTFFRRIIETQTRKEYEAFWSKFADMIKTLESPSALEEEELVDVATELEEVSAMLEGGQGHEVDLKSAMSRIRRTSRRLSGVVRLASVRKMAPPVIAEQPVVSGHIQKLVTFVTGGVASIKEQLSERDELFSVMCGALLFMFLLNVLAFGQLMSMNQSLHDLSASFEKMRTCNEVLLLKLTGGDSGDKTCLG